MERATQSKLTLNLLFFDDGLGFLLRYFRKAFKPHGLTSSTLATDQIELKNNDYRMGTSLMHGNIVGK